MSTGLGHGAGSYAGRRNGEVVLPNGAPLRGTGYEDLGTGLGLGTSLIEKCILNWERCLTHTHTHTHTQVLWDMPSSVSLHQKSLGSRYYGHEQSSVACLHVCCRDLGKESLIGSG